MSSTFEFMSKFVGIFRQIHFVLKHTRVPFLIGRMLITLFAMIISRSFWTGRLTSITKYRSPYVRHRLLVADFAF